MRVHPCPGDGLHGCLVLIAAERARCRYCTKTMALRTEPVPELTCVCGGDGAAPQHEASLLHRTWLRFHTGDPKRFEKRVRHGHDRYRRTG